MSSRIANWDELIANPRRGITGRLFQAGRKYFTTSSGRQSNARTISIPSKTDTCAQINLIVYPYQSPEALMRKLADYSFMLGDYHHAETIYDSIKKDFQSDHASKYYAGAQEMIGLCHLMKRDSLKDAEIQWDSAITTYLGQRCTAQAIKTAMLFYNCYKATGRWREAIKVLIRISFEFPVRSHDRRYFIFNVRVNHIVGCEPGYDIRTNST
jgi:hypothetical protein